MLKLGPTVLNVRLTTTLAISYYHFIVCYLLTYIRGVLFGISLGPLIFCGSNYRYMRSTILGMYELLSFLVS